MKKIIAVLLMVITVSLLTGCLYPQEQLQQNQLPYEDQIAAVQSSIEKYQSTNGGILPIKTRDQDTAIYIKYPIDFNKLKGQYLSEVPGNAYENGGVFQYVLINVEEKPTVKIFDLRIAETIREINLRIRSAGYPPFKERIADNVFTLDYSQIGYKEEPFVVSPYSNQNLPLLISGSGEIFVDYRNDLNSQLQEQDYTFEKGEDIRSILTENSAFVPAYSPSYTINEDNEPVFMMK
ncbi:MAG: lipoprotein [Bacillota bacterium]